MWQTRGESIDIVSKAHEGMNIENVTVSCFDVRFKQLTQTQNVQVAWYLQEHEAIQATGVKEAVDFLNFLNSHFISYKLKYNWFSTKGHLPYNVYVNMRVFFGWFMPIKSQLVMGNLKQWIKVVSL